MFILLPYCYILRAESWNLTLLDILLLCLSQVKVLYGGTELFDDEVRHTFHNDMMLAVISGVCITVLVYVLTSFSGTV